MEGRKQLCLNWVGVWVRPIWGLSGSRRGKQSSRKRERRKGGQLESQSVAERGERRGRDRGERKGGTHRETETELFLS